MEHEPTFASYGANPYATSPRTRCAPTRRDPVGDAAATLRRAQAPLRPPRPGLGWSPATDSGFPRIDARPPVAMLNALGRAAGG